MLETVLIAFAAAILSSLLTLALAHFVLKAAWERRLRDAVDQAIRDLGDEVEERVRRGVVEGVSAIPSEEVFARTRENLLRTAGSLVGEGLDRLAGKRRKP